MRATTIASSTSSLLWKFLNCCYLLLFVSGCASYGVVENEALSGQSSAKEYSIKAFAAERKDKEIFVELSFSGGGTRAAAVAYGVLLELRDTTVMLKRGPIRLLDEVDTISSVSGGSFTATYYGLHGDGMFDTFEEVFLRKNVEKPLIFSLFNPLHWFSSKGRTERAVDYYQKNIFYGATYADLMKPGRPLIVNNASDLAYGVRFSFVQEYFDLLCSDLLSFPVARAVTASSAVPVAFNPIVVENYFLQLCCYGWKVLSAEGAGDFLCGLQALQLDLSCLVPDEQSLPYCGGNCGGQSWPRDAAIQRRLYCLFTRPGPTLVHSLHC